MAHNYQPWYEEVINHAGGIDGYTSFIAFNPTKQIGLVILWSCDGRDALLPEKLAKCCNTIFASFLRYLRSRKSSPYYKYNYYIGIKAVGKSLLYVCGIKVG